MDPLDEKDTHLYGISFYKQILGGCVKRYFCEREVGEDGGVDAGFGTAVHAYLDPYHSRKPLPTLSEDIPQGGYVSPAEFMRRYSKRFSPDGFGQTLLSEKRLTMTLHDEECDIHRLITKQYQPEEPACICAGIPFVGTLDRLCRFDEADCELFFNERGVMLEPGDYLGDHKSKKSRSNVMIPSFMKEPQFTGYHMLAKANGFGELKGTLVNIMIRYKEDRDDAFVTLLIPPPDEDAIKVWEHIVREGDEKLRRKGRDYCDPTDCFSFSRECGCLSSCERYN
jgi:hypothetical protein